MIKVQLSESASSVAKTGGNRWKVVLAVPGEGHSGKYSRQVLEQYGPIAFPAGTKAFIKHATPQDRDPRDQFGKYPKTAWYDANEDGHLDTPTRKFPEGALVSELEVRKSFAETFEDMGEDAELSMYVKGEKDDDDNVISLEAYRGNSVDLVAFGALENSGVLSKLYESLQDDSDENSPETSAEEKKKKEEMATIEERIDALTKAVELLSAAKATEAKADADAEVQAKAEEIAAAKVDDVLGKYDEQIKQIDAAELVPSMAESLRLEARKGVDVTLLVESAKRTMDEVKKTLTESLSTGSGVWVNESAKTQDWTVR